MRISTPRTVRWSSQQKQSETPLSTQYFMTSINAGMQQARVGEIVGVVIEGGGALFGQVLDGPLGGSGGTAPGGGRARGGQRPGRDGEGVPDVPGFLRAAGVGGTGRGGGGVTAWEAGG
jgi:hypothetical protein